MIEALALAVACCGLLVAAAPAAPVVRVAFEGDAVAAAFVRARLTAAGIPVVDPGEADVRVRLRALDGAGVSGAARLHVVVEDRRGVLVDSVVAEDDPEDTRVSAWLVVRDAVDRVDLSAPARPERTPAPAALDLLVDAAPDPAFGALGAPSFFPVGVEAAARFDVNRSLRAVASVGYAAGLSSDVVLHSFPVRVGAEVHTGGDGLEWAAGVRASTTPTVALAKKSGGGLVAGTGVGSSVGAYGRALFPVGELFGGRLLGVVEAGVEARLVRQSVLADAGARQESVLAAPLAVGVEVRLP